jgi:ABC-type polysaccharide/polyol phosphate export permease
VTVLITISAVVAAGLVAWFLFSTTSGATKQPMLEVTGAYALCSGTSCSAVHITVRNMGTANVTITSATLDVAGMTGTTFSPPSGNIMVPLGGSANLKFAVSGTNTNIPDGASAVLTLTVTPASGSQQTLSIAFKIARP